jgi:hypothetical protein
MLSMNTDLDIEELDESLKNMKDLPAASNKGMDIYAAFENSLPFSQTLCTDFWIAIIACRKDCDDDNYVTLQSMSKVFWTNAWRSKIRDHNSRLCKVLSLSCFIKEEDGLAED